MALIENKSGAYVSYTTAAGQTALASVELPENLIAWVPDPTAKDAYPIVTYTWIMCHKTYKDKKTADAMKSVINYCLSEGQKTSEALGYIPLPDAVATRVRAAAEKISAEEKALLQSVWVNRHPERAILGHFSLSFCVFLGMETCHDS